MSAETSRTFGWSEKATALTASAAILLAAACSNQERGPVVVGLLEYSEDGTASRKIYEAADDPNSPDPLDKVAGGQVGTRYYRCEAAVPAVYLLVTTEKSTDGTQGEEVYDTSKACADGRIDSPEIP